MCYPTNKPCYSPPPRRAEPSTRHKERKCQRQRLRCGLALHSQSLFARSDSLLCAVIGWRAVQSGVRWLLRLEASLERMQGRSEACCYCYHRELLQERGPRREPSCADGASRKETRMLRNRRGSTEKPWRLAGSYLVFFA